MPIKIIAGSRATALKVQSEILGCESCSDDAELPLEWLLDQMIGRGGRDLDYVLPERLKCPRWEVTEQT
jgi:hypothetical protein